MINNLERRFGRFAIPRLMNVLIGGYIIGYVLYLLSGLTQLSLLSYLTLEPYYILHGQVWRLITWVLIPPTSAMTNPIFAIIMVILYWQLGTTLENTWGTFRFNVYIFGGILFTVIGAFVLYILNVVMTGIPFATSSFISTDYINLSIFLAFAVTYPDMQVLLYFIIPIKMKWMALVYVVMVVFDLGGYIRMGDWNGPVAIIASLLNFILFFLATRKHPSPSAGAFGRGGGMPFGKGAQRQNPFGKNTGQRGGFSAHNMPQTKPQSNPFGKTTNVARHKCAICGRTDISNPELTFRFCSKCNGNYEYCNDHLFTHTHIV